MMFKDVEICDGNIQKRVTIRWIINKKGPNIFKTDGDIEKVKENFEALKL